MGKNFKIEEGQYPDLSQVMLATLNALRAIGGSASIQELLEQVVEMEDITESEQAVMTPNGKHFSLNYALAWSRTFLRKVGAIENSSRGIWALTDKGEKIISRDETKAIEQHVRAEYSKRRGSQIEAKGAEDSEHEESIEDGSLDDLSEEWHQQLLGILQEMAPAAFERLAQRILREAGFTKVEVRGKSGDGGIDGVGVLSVNLISFQVYFQCKRWKGSVPSKEI